MWIVRRVRSKIAYGSHFLPIQDLSVTIILKREKAKAVNSNLSGPPSEGR